jgi:hypothetical protein
MNWKADESDSFSELDIDPFTLRVSCGDNGKFYAAVFRNTQWCTGTPSMYKSEASAQRAAIRLFEKYLASEWRVLRDAFTSLTLQSKGSRKRMPMFVPE